MYFLLFIPFVVVPIIVLVSIADAGGPRNDKERISAWIAIAVLIISIAWPLVSYNMRVIERTVIKDVGIVNNTAIISLDDGEIINLNTRFNRNLFSFNKVEVRYYSSYCLGVYWDELYEMAVIEPEMKVLEDFLRGIIIPEEPEIPLKKKII